MGAYNKKRCYVSLDSSIYFSNIFFKAFYAFIPERCHKAYYESLHKDLRLIYLVKLVNSYIVSHVAVFLKFYFKLNKKI